MIIQVHCCGEAENQDVPKYRQEQRLTITTVTHKHTQREGGDHSAIDAHDVKIPALQS